MRARGTKRSLIDHDRGSYCGQSPRAAAPLFSSGQKFRIVIDTTPALASRQSDDLLPYDHWNPRPNDPPRIGPRAGEGGPVRCGGKA